MDRTSTHSISTIENSTTEDVNGYLTSAVYRARSTPDTVHDIKYDVTLRIVCLYVIIFLGVIGGALVTLWMWFNRGKRSRVNFFILNLTIADLSVIFFGCIPQIIAFEYLGRKWYGGDFLCRLIKFLQGSSLMSSSYMLVVLAIDRHQAIRSPLKRNCSVRCMSLFGWCGSMLLASPNLFVFHTNNVNGTVRCENIFRTRTNLERGAFILYALLMSFFVPLLVLTVCYLRIFIKVSQKATESSSCRKELLSKSGKVQLTCSQGSSLPRAKIKTLKMTVVIVLAFILCGLPYFIAELIMSFGDFKILSLRVYALLGALAPANSAVNPYVFLLFSVNWSSVRDCCCSYDDASSPKSQRQKLSLSSDRLEMTVVHMNSSRRSTGTRVELANAMDVRRLYE